MSTCILNTFINLQIQREADMIEKHSLYHIIRTNSYKNCLNAKSLLSLCDDTILSAAVYMRAQLLLQNTFFLS